MSFGYRVIFFTILLQELIVVFDNLLEDTNQDGWQQLQMVLVVKRVHISFLCVGIQVHALNQRIRGVLVIILTV